LLPLAGLKPWTLPRCCASLCTAIAFVGINILRARRSLSVAGLLFAFGSTWLPFRDRLWTRSLTKLNL
jgi:hypothetical protein